MSKEKKGVRLDHISKIYQDPKTGKDFYAVKDTSLTIEPGSFVTLLGPSGCGKTTTLRMIAGFESPDEGEIYLGDEAINALTPNKRDTAMVFQSYALLPHYNVFDNVAYGLKLRKVPKDEIQKRVMKILDLVELTGMEGRMTNQLSGGQQQRVALARALVIEPSVLLFDEPLSNLDAKLRVQMRTTIKKLQRRLGITTIYVTHDQEEALAISDRIAVMKDGVIHHCGRPDNIYQRPADVFVATFIGKTNLLAGQMSEENGQAYITVCGSGRIPFHTIRPDAVGSREVILSIRPEEFKVWRDGETSEGLRATIRDSVFLGPNTHYFAQLENGEEVEIIQESEIDSMIRPGSSILLTINAGKANVFDKETSLSLMTGVKHSVELPEVGA